jgi:hypothetical protein
MEGATSGIVCSHIDAIVSDRIAAVRCGRCRRGYRASGGGLQRGAVRSYDAGTERYHSRVNPESDKDNGVATYTPLCRIGLPRFVVDVAGVVIEVPRETRYSAPLRVHPSPSPTIPRLRQVKDDHFRKAGVL